METRYFVCSLFKSKKDENGFYASMIYRLNGSPMCTLDNKGFTKVCSGSVFYQIKEALEKGAMLVEVEAVTTVTQYGPQLQIVRYIDAIEIE